MMTRKDYIIAAEILSNFIKETNDGSNPTAVDDFENYLVNPFIDMFKDDNLNFNSEKFWEACFG